MRRVRYRFLGRALGRYWWERVVTVGLRDKRMLASRPVDQFWGRSA